MAQGPQLQDCDYLRLLLPDICGAPRSKILTPIAFNGFVNNGLRSFHGMIGFACDGTPCVRQLPDLNCGNGLLLPDWSTLYTSATAASSGARYKDVICSMHSKTTKEPLAADTRQLAMRMIQELHKLNLRVYSTYEIEFRLFLKSGDPAWPEIQFAHAPTMSAVEPYLNDLAQSCSAAGVQIEVLHGEYGSGQIEVNLVPQFGVAAADHGFLFKLIAKEVANRHGYTASFMTKPLPGQTGNGWHLNLSLWSPDNHNLFYSDGTQPTEVARHFMAGLVQHTPALTALCSPTFNCYRRLHTPWAPDKCDVRVDGRFSTYRLQCDTESLSRVENRLVSSACNPYLALAATLAAGIDGIRRGREVDEAMMDRSVPYSLEEALSELHSDEQLRNILGDDVINWFDVAKTDIELKGLSDVDLKEDSERAMRKERTLYRDI